MEGKYNDNKTVKKYYYIGIFVLLYYHCNLKSTMSCKKNILWFFHTIILLWKKIKIVLQCITHFSTEFVIPAKVKRWAPRIIQHSGYWEEQSPA